MKLLTVCLFLAAIFFLIMWIKPSNHDRELDQLKQENAEIEARLKIKDDSLENSLKREIALSLEYRRSKALSDSAIQVATLSIKRYEREKKLQKTGILSQGSYDSVLLVLYPK